MTSARSLIISIDRQTLEIMEGGEIVCSYPISTAVKGVGFTMGSYRTPVGRFRVCEKVGEGLAAGTIFKQRVAVGRWRAGAQQRQRPPPAAGGTATSEPASCSVCRRPFERLVSEWGC